MDTMLKSQRDSIGRLGRANGRRLAGAFMAALGVLGGGLAHGATTAPEDAEPFNQALVAPSVAELAQFGSALAVSEKTVVVGAPGDSSAGTAAGAVHVYLRDELTGAFTETQVLQPPTLTAFDRFGGAVAVGGNVLVVGAKGDDEVAPNAGAAYVYRRFGFGAPFTLTNKLVAPNGGVSDCFGASVAVLANKLAVGAPRSDETAFDAGAVYTFTFDFQANQASYDGPLLDPTGAAGDGFGTALAISPAVLAVGSARLDAPSGPQNTGAVVVYEAQGSGTSPVWVKVQTIFPSVPSSYAGFGSALAMEPPRPGTSGTLVIGAPEAQPLQSNVHKGSVSVYTSGLPVQWSEAFQYGLQEAGSGNRLGASVAVEGDVILAGAPGREPLGGQDENVGSMDLLRFSSGTGWAVERTIEMPGASDSWFVGEAVALRSGYPLVGAPGAVLDSGLEDQGTAWSVCHTWAPLGELLCAPAVPNSTGHPASLVARGSAVASARSLTLEAAFLPRHSFAYALASKDSGFAAGPGGSQGNLCLAGAVGRLVHDYRQAGNDGRIEIVINTHSIPQPAGATSAVAGETWWFQVWYRDANPSVTSNFTDAVELQFL